jgi:hypothetical protein
MEPLGHADMRDGILLERLAFASVAELGVETLGAHAGVEHDQEKALVARPDLCDFEQSRADPHPSPRFADSHLPQLQPMQAQRLQ